MRKYFIILLALASCLLCASCRQRTAKETKSSTCEPAMTGQAVIDSLKAGDPVRLCEQRLTSPEGTAAAFPEECPAYDRELIPVRSSFFFPEKGIQPSKLVEQVRIRYNMVSVLNRVVHSYEWFCRYSSAEADSLSTRRDTLAWVRTSQPGVSSTLLAEVLPDASARGAASKFLASYRRFNGDSGEGSAFANAFSEYRDAVLATPAIASGEQSDSLEAGFWEWYDKEQFVPGIDQVIKMNMQGAPKWESTDEWLEHFAAAVLSEPDIDRRAILALEYAKFDNFNAVPMLGEIMESGIYTRYLYEVWTSWRAHVQMNHAPSSFAVIPNNYFDRLRVKCMNTCLEHYQKTGDWRDLCFIENFICTDIMHRQGSIAGNESLAILAGLSYGEFIHPRLTGEKD